VTDNGHEVVVDLLAAKYHIADALLRIDRRTNPDAHHRVNQALSAVLDALILLDGDNA
jgi:hypothetical protein